MTVEPITLVGLRVEIQLRAWTFVLELLFYSSGRLNNGVVTHPLDPTDFLL